MSLWSCVAVLSLSCRVALLGCHIVVELCRRGVVGLCFRGVVELRCCCVIVLLCTCDVMML